MKNTLTFFFIYVFFVACLGQISAQSTYRNIVRFELTTPKGVPQSLRFYLQSTAHSDYDKLFDNNECIYMGFELLDPKHYNFVYDCQFNTAPTASFPTTMATRAEKTWEKLQTRDPTFTGVTTTVTIIPFPETCKPIEYYDVTEDRDKTAYPCGNAGTCRQCDTTDPCSNSLDCIYSSKCVENKCSILGSPASRMAQLSRIIVCITALLGIILIIT